MERYGADTDFRPPRDSALPVYGTTYRRPSRKQFKAAVAQLYASYELLAELPCLATSSSSTPNAAPSPPSYDVASSEPPSYQPPAPSASSSSSSSKIDAETRDPPSRRRRLLEFLLPGLKLRGDAPHSDRPFEARIQRVYHHRSQACGI